MCVSFQQVKFQFPLTFINLYFRLNLTASHTDSAEDKHNSSTDSFESSASTALPLLPTGKQKSRSVIKSASTSGLSLVIPTGDFSSTYYILFFHRYSNTSVMFIVFIVVDPTSSANQSIESPGGSSTASSRDTSPCRELSPLVTSLKPPIIIRRGPNGFGFTVHTIRVYYGDSDFYTMHHLVMVRYFSFSTLKL